MIRSSACQPWQPDLPGHAGDRGDLLSYTTPRDTILARTPQQPFPASLQRSAAEWNAIRDPAQQAAAKRRRTHFAEVSARAGIILLTLNSYRTIRRASDPEGRCRRRS